MKKFVIAIIVAAGIVGLVALNRFKTKPATSSTATGTNTPGPASTTSSSAASSGSTAPTYKDGSYTGTAIDNGYGIVQVEAVISGGKLSDVKFLQMPSGG